LLSFIFYLFSLINYLIYYFLFVFIFVILVYFFFFLFLFLFDFAGEAKPLSATPAPPPLPTDPFSTLPNLLSSYSFCQFKFKLATSPSSNSNTNLCPQISFQTRSSHHPFTASPLSLPVTNIAAPLLPRTLKSPSYLKQQAYISATILRSSLVSISITTVANPSNPLNSSCQFQHQTKPKSPQSLHHGKPVLTSTSSR
jgi:hypothetical protein